MGISIICCFESQQFYCFTFWGFILKTVFPDCRRSPFPVAGCSSPYIYFSKSEEKNISMQRMWNRECLLIRNDPAAIFTVQWRVLFSRAAARPVQYWYICTVRIILQSLGAIIPSSDVDHNPKCSCLQVHHQRAGQNTMPLATRRKYIFSLWLPFINAQQKSFSFVYKNLLHNWLPYLFVASGLTWTFLVMTVITV